MPYDGTFDSGAPFPFFIPFRRICGRFPAIELTIVLHGLERTRLVLPRPFCNTRAAFPLSNTKNPKNQTNYTTFPPVSVQVCGTENANSFLLPRVCGKIK